MNKFTATLVTNETKNTVIELRKALNLDEKTLMGLIVRFAIETPQAYADMLAEADRINNEYASVKAEKRRNAYEALKERLKAERAENRAARKAAKAAAKAELEKASAEKPKKARKSKSVKAILEPFAPATVEVIETAPVTE